MNHDQERDAVIRSLLMPERRTDRHNVYYLAPKQERQARAELFSSRAREQNGNVIPLGTRRPPEPPKAA